MPAVSSIALAVGAAAAIAGTAYTIKHGQEMEKSASDAADAQSVKQDEMINAAKAQGDKQESQANNNAVREQAKARQAALTAGAGGRNSTILTSPLGLQDEAQGANKSLLGS